MFMRPAGPCPPDARLRPWLGGWFLLLLFLFSACTQGSSRSGLMASYRPRSLVPPSAPRAGGAFAPEPGLEAASVYAVGVLEPGKVATRPVPIGTAEFQRAVQRLSREMRLGGKTPREAALELLRLPPSGEVETVESRGDWVLETYWGRAYTFMPEQQQGPVALTPAAEEALREKYLKWCEWRGGGDCLGLLDDGPYLRTDDRRTLALALAFGTVLDETRAALARELLDVRALVSLVMWTVALYCLMWVVPEPTTKALAAGLTLLLMGYLGLSTVYGLMDGWARMDDAAHQATTFEELRAAGEAFGKVLGEDAARAMILAVTTLAGHTLGQVAARVKSLPGFNLAGAQFEVQGGAAAVAPEVAAEVGLAHAPALARAVVAAETVATSPEGPLAVVMLKKGTGGRGRDAGERGAETVLRHRGGNRQVQLASGQRWHLPRGASVADIPAEDKVGDLLQEVVTKAAKEWGPHRLSRQERSAIDEALKKGEYWLARLLEREARGRFVQQKVKDQFGHLYDFNLGKGIDVVDPSPGGFKYEILSGTESNLARHGRRMAGEFFRMLTF
jgi:hypothetical protein